MSTFKITIFGFFLLIALASGSKCPQEDASKLVVCYYKSEISLSNFNICSCSHVVFINGVKKGENSTLNLNEGVKRNLDLIKKKKDDVLALFTLEIKSNEISAILKSEIRSDELITGIADLLQESDFNGVELNFKFSSDDGVSKDSFASFVKKLSKLLSSAHRRVKREGYDVFEKLQDDVTTAAYTTQTPKNSTSRTQSINRRGKKKSRNTREDRDNAGQTEKISLEEAINKEFSSKKSTELQANKSEEDKSGENKFLIFVRLSVKPEIIAKKFDLKLLDRFVDIFLVPTHDISNENEDHLTYHPSRLMGISDVLNTDSVLDFLTGIGAPKSKIVITMPLTVLKFQLKDITKNTPRSPSSARPQTIDQSQFCSLLAKSNNWTIERDEDLTAPYAYSGKTWLAFEDETSISIKGKYILLRELAGGAVYPIDADTNAGSCPNRTRSGFLVESLRNNFQNFGRKPRALVLQNLQEEIHSTGFSGIEAGIKHSEYRIVRVVDHSGAVHVVRKNTKTQFECSRQGYFSHPLGCNKFYRCVKFDQYSDEFTVFEYDCPAGLAFDERWEVCVWPGSLPHGSPCTGSSEIAPVPRSHYKCPNQEGYYADLENCRWFFACLDHARDGVTPLTAYEFRCPFGLVFNEEKLACDWPWLIGACGNQKAAGFLKTHAEFINGGNLAASSGQYSSLEQEATFHGFGRGFRSGLGLREGAQSAGFGYIDSGIDNGQDRAAFGFFPDYAISGGRIFNKEGVILEQHVVGLQDSAGKSGSLHVENARGLNIIPGSLGTANKQSGFLYHRNSQSSYGQGSISLSGSPVSVPAQNEYTGHSTLAANNLLLEYGQKEKYKGDASFQDAVATPKPFFINIPKVEINQFETSTGQTSAGNTLLAAEFGQKEDTRHFISKTKPHIFGDAVLSGGSPPGVTSSVAFSTTPAPSSFEFGVSRVSSSKGYSLGNENLGEISSVTARPNVYIPEYTSSPDLQGEVGTKGISLQQFVDIQPKVSINTPALFSTTSRPSIFKSVNQDFKYSSEQASGFSSSVGVNKLEPSISNIATLKPVVHSFGQDSGNAVKTQSSGQGVHFSTLQSSIKPLTSSVTRPGIPINAGHFSESENSVNIGGGIIPKAEVPTFGYKSSRVQDTVSVQGLPFNQVGGSLSTPVSLGANSRVQETGPIAVTLSQPAINIGNSFKQSAGDVNFGGSVTSIPGTHTFEYISSLGKESAINGHGVFGQKFTIQTNVPTSTIKPQSLANDVSNQPVTPVVHQYSSGIEIKESSSSRPSLHLFEQTSSPIDQQGLIKYSSKGTIPYSNLNEDFRAISQIGIDQPAVPVSGGPLLQSTGQVETSNARQSGFFASTLGRQITQDTSFDQIADVHPSVSVSIPPSFSATLATSNFKVNNQGAHSVGVGYSSEKHSTKSSGRSNGSASVISSTLKPVVDFQQTRVELSKQDGGGKFEPSFVSTLAPPTFTPVGVSIDQTVSGYSVEHGKASTVPESYSFEYTADRNQQSTDAKQNLEFGQSLSVQPVSVSTLTAFGTSSKPQTFKSLGVSVSRPVLGVSIPHYTSESGVGTFESRQSLNAQDKKISHPFTPADGVSSYESGFRASSPTYSWEGTSFSKRKQIIGSISSEQFVPSAEQILKNTEASLYSYGQYRTPQNLFQKNIDVKVSSEINSNKDITYGVPAKAPESGLFDGTFNAKATTDFIPTADKTAESPAQTYAGQQFSYDSVVAGRFASSKKLSSTPTQQKILAEFSIEKQPIESVDFINPFKYDQSASTLRPNTLLQGVDRANIPFKTINNYKQQIFTQDIKPLTSTATLQQKLVPVTENKSYLPPVTPKTDILKPIVEVVPFKSLEVKPEEENFEFLKSPVNELKPREELIGLEITKSIELNPKELYHSTVSPVTIQQQRGNPLSQTTYSVDATRSSGKGRVQAGHGSFVSSTSLPISSTTVKTTSNDEDVALSGNDGVTPGLFKPNIEISASRTTSQNGQLLIAEPPQFVPVKKENIYFQPASGFDFKKIKFAQISSQPQSAFGSQNITRFSLNPSIEIPEPSQEYLAQFSTQSLEPPTRSNFKSIAYGPPGTDNFPGVLNKYNGRFGLVNKGEGSPHKYQASSTVQQQKSRGRQYHGGITSNQKNLNEYKKYDVNGQDRSDSKTVIDLTNLKVDKDKKTVIVVSQVSDANPILIGKLAGQCSCQSNVIELKTKGKKHSNNKTPQIVNQFLPPVESSFQKDANAPESIAVDGKSATTPEPLSSTILSSLSPDGILTITPKSVYAGSLKAKQFRGKARYFQPAEDLLSAVPASEIASTVDYPGNQNEINYKEAGAAFDRYGPGGWRGFDETLQGSVDCKRPGLFRHPKYCNKFYSCNYDPWKEKYVLHVFNCPIHLAYDSSISACNWPVRGPACADDNLLV